jgi:hypothetical protein
MKLKYDGIIIGGRKIGLSKRLAASGKMHDNETRKSSASWRETIICGPTINSVIRYSALSY